MPQKLTKKSILNANKKRFCDEILPFLNGIDFKCVVRRDYNDKELEFECKNKLYNIRHNYLGSITDDKEDVILELRVDVYWDYDIRYLYHTSKQERGWIYFNYQNRTIPKDCKFDDYIITDYRLQNVEQHHCFYCNNKRCKDFKYHNKSASHIKNRSNMLDNLGEIFKLPNDCVIHIMSFLKY